MHPKTKWVLIGAVLLLDLQSFTALTRHMETHGADDRIVSSAIHHNLRQAGVLPQMLVERGVHLLQ